TGFRTSTVVGSIVRAHPTCTRLAHVAIPEHTQDSRHTRLSEHGQDTRHTGKSLRAGGGTAASPRTRKDPATPSTRRFRSAGHRGAQICVRLRARGRRPVRSDLFDEADVADGDLFADFLGQESLDPTRGLEVPLGRADRGYDG